MCRTDHRVGLTDCLQSYLALRIRPQHVLARGRALAPFLAQITSLPRDCHSLLRPSMAAFLDNTQDQDFQAFGRGRVHDLRDRAIPMVRPVF